MMIVMIMMLIMIMIMKGVSFSTGDPFGFCSFVLPSSC